MNRPTCSSLGSALKSTCESTSARSRSSSASSCSLDVSAAPPQSSAVVLRRPKVSAVLVDTEELGGRETGRSGGRGVAPAAGHHHAHVGAVGQRAEKLGLRVDFQRAGQGGRLGPEQGGVRHRRRAQVDPGGSEEEGSGERGGDRGAPGPAARQPAEWLGPIGSRCGHGSCHEGEGGKPGPRGQVDRQPGRARPRQEGAQRPQEEDGRRQQKGLQQLGGAGSGGRQHEAGPDQKPAEHEAGVERGPYRAACRGRRRLELRAVVRDEQHLEQPRRREAVAVAQRGHWPPELEVGRERARAERQRGRR
eukprot:scaffold12131_cov112-Isochrysis_galbana.AAC.1